MAGRNFSRAVVTGGAGFLGAAFCDALLERGTEVLCLDSLLTGSAAAVRRFEHHPRYRFRQVDVSEYVDVPGPVDLVAHLACPASPAAYRRSPVETLLAGGVGTVRMLDLACEKGARLLLASTSEVYGDPQVHPQAEDYWGHVNPVGPRSVYDEAKRYGEAAVVAYRAGRSVNAGIARIFNSYGPGMRADDGRMVPNFILSCLRGEPITVTGDGSQTRSLCYVDDTVAGLTALAESDVEGPVNIGNPRERTVLEIAREVRAVLDSDSPIRHIDAMVDDPHRRCPDITLAGTRLGWRPEVGFTEGIKRTAEWFATSEPG